LYTNQAVKKAFGKSLVGRTCYRELQGGEAPCHFCTNEIILKQKPAPYRWEYHNPLIEKYFDVTDCIITWPDGRDVRLEFAHDITDRKLLNNELRKKNEDLARSNAELDDFAYIVSHDLKEPLRSIHSFSSFLAEDYKDRLDDEGQAHLDTVKQSAQRMTALLDDLLIYSRVGRGHLAKKNHGSRPGCGRHTG
jgi:signal transduction histidine kinase